MSTTATLERTVCLSSYSYDDGNDDATYPVLGDAAARQRQRDLLTMTGDDLRWSLLCRDNVYTIRYLLPFDLWRTWGAAWQTEWNETEPLPDGGFVLLTRDYVPLGSWWHTDEDRHVIGWERRDPHTMRDDDYDELLASYALHRNPTDRRWHCEVMQELTNLFGRPSPDWRVYDDETNPINGHDTATSNALLARYTQRLVALAALNLVPVDRSVEPPAYAQTQLGAASAR